MINTLHLVSASSLPRCLKCCQSRSSLLAYSLLNETSRLIHHVSNEKSAGPLRETESCWVIRKDRNGELTWGQGEMSEELMQVPGD